MDSLFTYTSIHEKEKTVMILACKKAQSMT